MKNRTRVRDFDKLFRDNKSRAIVNSDTSGYQARVRRKAVRSQEHEDIIRLTQELKDLKAMLEELKRGDNESN